MNIQNTTSTTTSTITLENVLDWQAIMIQENDGSTIPAIRDFLSSFRAAGITSILAPSANFVLTRQGQNDLIVSSAMMAVMAGLNKNGFKHAAKWPQGQDQKTVNFPFYATEEVNTKAPAPASKKSTDTLESVLAEDIIASYANVASEVMREAQLEVTRLKALSLVAVSGDILEDYVQLLRSGLPVVSSDFIVETSRSETFLNNLKHAESLEQIKAACSYGTKHDITADLIGDSVIITILNYDKDSLQAINDRLAGYGLPKLGKFTVDSPATARTQAYIETSIKLK